MTPDEAEVEVDRLNLALVRLQLAYDAVLTVAWHNHEATELALQQACGWAFDHARQGVACFWCKTPLGHDDDAVRAHVALCRQEVVR